MSVVLEKLSFSHMFSYGANNVLDLNTNTVTQLIATNGTGKSSLAIIIQELLFNKNIKGLKKSDILNRYSGSKTWDGRLDFSVDGVGYSVISKRSGASTSVSFLREGKDISEHKVLDTYKAISEVIGRDFETFSQLTYQSSTDSLEFLKATDSNRKKFLINLFNLERYIELGEQLKTTVSSKEKELAVKQGELKSVSAFIDSNTVPDKALEKPVPEVDTSLYSKIDSLKSQIAAQRKICDAIDQNNLRVRERDSLKFDVSLSPVEIPESLKQQIQDLTSKVAQLQSSRSRVQRDLKALDLSDVCYACKQPIDNSKSKTLSDELRSELENLSSEIASLTQEITSLSNDLKKLEQAKNAYEANQRSIDRFTTLSQLIDPSVPTEYPDYNKLSSDLKKLEQELAWQEKENKDAKAHNESVRIRNAKVDALVEQLRNFKARQELLNNDIVVIQEEISTLSILRKAFSTSGIVAFKLENVTKQLEESINKYLAVLSDGQFQIVFRLDGEKLNVIVVNNGQEVTIDSLSGGEFSRVQTSVLLAVRQTLATIGGKSINLLFLDEITGVLDEAGKERLFEVLQEETGLNVFLISHDYSHPLVPKVEITKENNISSINS